MPRRLFFTPYRRQPPGHWKVYTVDMQITLTISATTRARAAIVARDTIARLPEFSTLKVTNICCPAEGQ
jgi:hypothetical protein